MLTKLKRQLSNHKEGVLGGVFGALVMSVVYRYAKKSANITYQITPDVLDVLKDGGWIETRYAK